jgi:hypothetical protein
VAALGYQDQLVEIEAVATAADSTGQPGAGAP